MADVVALQVGEGAAVVVVGLAHLEDGRRPGGQAGQGHRPQRLEVELPLEQGHQLAEQGQAAPVVVGAPHGRLQPGDLVGVEHSGCRPAAAGPARRPPTRRPRRWPRAAPTQSVSPPEPTRPPFRGTMARCCSTRLSTPRPPSRRPPRRQRWRCWRPACGLEPRSCRSGSPSCPGSCASARSGSATRRSATRPPRPPRLTARGRRGLRPIGRAAGRGSQAERRRLVPSCSAGDRGRAALPAPADRRRAAPGRARRGDGRGDRPAAGVPAADVRRAVMLRGDLGRRRRRPGRGRAWAERVQLEVGRPVLPMLARTAPDRRGGLGRHAAVEWKLDGARVQVHRDGDEVRVYTRSLDDITARVPEVVAAALALPVRAVVLDGEASRCARRPAAPVPGHGQPLRQPPGRRAAARHAAAHAFFFDVLHLDGADLLDRPGPSAHAALAAVVPAELLVPRTVTADPAEAEAFLARRAGPRPRGRVVKALDAPYEAGRRGAGWMKVKPRHTLDLVVLAAEWGHGRRKGWLPQPAPGCPRTRDRRVRDARQDVQGPDRRDAAPGRPSASSSWTTAATAMGRPRAARTGGRDRLRRRAAQHPLPGRGRPALRPGGALPRGQAADEADTIETVRAIHTP